MEDKKYKTILKKRLNNELKELYEKKRKKVE